MKRIVPLIFYVVFFGVLNETVFNVSTPSLIAQYGLTSSQVSWVVTIFIITFGLGSVVYGKLSDIYSVRSLIVLGITIYCVGSALGFIGQRWYPVVVLARAIQGAGASAIPALVMVLVARFFTPQERGKLFGLMTSTVSFAIGVGPVIGGFVASKLHWSFLFLIPFFTLVALPYFRKWIPHEEKRPGKIDTLGAALVAVSISSLILFATEPYWPFALISAASLVWFVVHIRRSPHPFVEPALFSNREYRSGLVIGFLIFCTVMSIMFVVPLMLHHLYGLDTDAIGLIMFPGAFSAVIFGTVAGRLTAKRGSHFVVLSGLLLLALSMVLLSGLAGKWVWLLSGTLVFMYVGLSFVQTALAESITQILPPPKMGVGMGFYSLVAFISAAIGTALVARAMDNAFLQIRLNPWVTDPNAYLYSNLILLFGGIILLCGVYYYAAFGRNKQEVRDPAAYRPH